MKIVGDIVLLPVALNDTTFSFLLDTGSEESSIDPKTAAKLGLAPEGTERVQKNFRDLVVDVTEISSMHIGTQSFHHVKMAEINLVPLSQALGTDVDGVLGNDVLQDLTFKVIYSRGKLLIGPLRSLGRLGTPTPLRRSRGQFLIAARFMSVAGEFVFDTGTNSTNLSWKTWELLTATWAPPQIVRGIQRAGNPTSSAILTCVPTIQFAGGVLKNQAVRAQTKSDAGVFSSENFDGILGSDLLRQFEITFDLRNNTAYFRRDANYRPDPYRYVTIGIQISKTPQGTFEIMAVWNDSPAEEAGIKAGDIIKEIDGKPLNAFTLDQVSRGLHASEGTTIRLRLVRNSTLFTVAVRTRNLLCKPNRSRVTGSQ